MACRNRFFKFFLRNVLDHLVGSEGDAVTWRRAQVIRSLRKNRSAKRITLQDDTLLGAAKIRLVAPLDALQALAIHPRKAKHMGHQRPLGVETPPFHHHPDALQGHPFQSSPLLGLQFPRDPDEASLLPEFFLDLACLDVQEPAQVACHP